MHGRADTHQSTETGNDLTRIRQRRMQSGSYELVADVVSQTPSGGVEVEEGGEAAELANVLRVTPTSVPDSLPDSLSDTEIDIGVAALTDPRANTRTDTKDVPHQRREAARPRPNKPRARADEKGDNGRRDFGERLSRARASRELTLDDIAATTRIPIRSLEGLEAGQFERLPAAVFVRGFLRSYARCVGLDGEYIVRCYEELIAVPDAHAGQPAPGALPHATDVAGVAGRDPHTRRTSTATASPQEERPPAPRRGSMMRRLATLVGAGIDDEDRPAASEQVRACTVAERKPNSAPERPSPERPSPERPSPVSNQRRRSRYQRRITTTGMSAASRLGHGHAAALPPSGDGDSGKNRASSGIKSEISADAPSSTVLSRNDHRDIAHDIRHDDSDKARRPAAIVDPDCAEGPVTAGARAQATADEGDDKPNNKAAPARRARASQRRRPRRRPRQRSRAASAHTTPRSRMPVLVIDDERPEEAERTQAQRSNRGDTSSWGIRLPPVLLDGQERSYRGVLAMAVVILVIVATVTMSYLLRKPGFVETGAAELPPAPAVSAVEDLD